MPALPSSLALELIRASTASAHRALENTLEVAQPDAGEPAYARYLEALWGWLAPLESALWLAAWPEAIVAPARSGKIRWIEADLRARGRDASSIASLPRQLVLPRLDSIAERFGAAYVVEGSQLGGQSLLRQLGPRISPLPVRWLEGYGRDTAARWRSFVAALGAHLTSRADAELAAQSARTTFELAHAWFAERGVA